MNKDEVVAKLHDHDNRLRVLEIGQARMMVLVGVGTVFINALTTIVMHFALK